MAPTVCMADVPIPVADAPCRRIRHRGEIARHPRMEIQYVPSLGTNIHSVRTHCPTSLNWKTEYTIEKFISKSKFPRNQSSEQWKIVMKRRRGLLEIAARTIALIHRNHLLQKKVDALRYETKDFLETVFDNSENKINGVEKTTSNVPNVILSSNKNHEFQDNETIESFDKDTITNTPNNQVTSTCIFSDSDNSISSDSYASDDSDH